MENYEQTIETIEDYKDKACWFAGNNCDKCEAMFEYYSEQFCCFDTVTRFIEYVNKYKH